MSNREITYSYERLGYDDQEACRRWANENYKLFSPIDGRWHPIVQYECVRMNAKAGYSPDKHDAPIAVHKPVTRKTADGAHASPVTPL